MRRFTSAEVPGPSGVRVGLEVEVFNQIADNRESPALNTENRRSRLCKTALLELGGEFGDKILTLGPARGDKLP